MIQQQTKQKRLRVKILTRGETSCMQHVFCIVAESISLDLLFVKVASLSEAHPFLVAQDRALKVQGILPPFLVKFMKFPLTCALNHVDGYVASRVGAEKSFWFSHPITII